MNPLTDGAARARAGLLLAFIARYALYVHRRADSRVSPVSPNTTGKASP